MIEKEGLYTTITHRVNYGGQPKTVIIHKTDAVTLPEMLDFYGEALRGMGYVFEGTVEIVNE